MEQEDTETDAQCDVCEGTPCKEYKVEYPNGDVLTTCRCSNHRGALENLRNYGVVEKKRTKVPFKVSTVEDIQKQLHKE